VFGNKEQKAAQDVAARGEADRLAGLSAADLAAEMMPAFAPDGPGRGNPPEVNLIQLGAWLMRAYPRGTKYLRDLERPLREAVQALENAGLVERRGQQTVGSRLSATRLGEQALADGGVREAVTRT
jgi:hypothetical protein